MPTPDKIDQLYDALKADGAVKKSRENFRNYISDPSNRRTLYEALKADGAVNSPTFEEFDSRLGMTDVTPQQPVNTASQPAQQRRVAKPSVGMPQWKTSAMPEEVQEKFAADEKKQASASVTTPTSTARPKKEQVAPENLYKQSGEVSGYTSADNITNASVDEKPTGEAPSKEFRSEIENSLQGLKQMREANDERMANMRKGNLFGANDVEYNPVTGKFETVYYTKGGEKTGSLLEQADENLRIGNPNEWARKHNKAQVAGLLKSIDEQLEQARERATDEFIKDDNIQTLSDKDASLGSKLKSAFRLNSMTPQQLAYEFKTPEVIDLSAAKRAMENAQNIIDEADKSAREGKFENFRKGVGRGFTQRFSEPSTWSMGLADFDDNSAIFDALAAFEEGKELTPSQQALLDAKVVELATTEFFGSDLGRGYKAGQVTADAIPFMIEMIANPLSATGKGAAKLMAKYAMKRFARSAIKSGLKRATIVGLKNGARMVGSIPGAAGMAATSGAVRVAAEATRRMTGTPTGDYDESGNLVFTGVDNRTVEDPLTAWMKGFGKQTIEDWTEMFLPEGGVAVGRILSKAAARTGNIGLKTVNGWVRSIGASRFGKAFTKMENRAQWQGAPQEFMEEIYNGLADAAIIGDQKIRGKDGKIWGTTDKEALFNQDNLIDTGLGVGVMSVLLPFAKTVGYIGTDVAYPKLAAAKYKHQARKAMTAADEVGLMAFGGDQMAWGALRNTLAFGTEDAVKNTVKAAMANNNYTNEQKRAVMDYAIKAQGYRGVEDMYDQMKADIYNPTTRTAIDALISYDNAYEDATSEEERLDAHIYYASVREKLRGMLDEETMRRFEADPIAVKTEMEESGRYSDDVIYTAGQYVAIKSAVDGIEDRINDDAEKQAAQERDTWNKRRNNAGGYTRLKMQIDGEDVEVWWHDGVLVLNDDGTVNTQDSDPTITVWDEVEGKNRMVSPSDVEVIESIGEGDIESQIEDRRQENVQSAMDAATGTVRVQPGYEFTKADGTPARVIGINDSDVIYVNLNTRQQESMPRDEVQQIVDGMILDEFYKRHPEVKPQQQRTVRQDSAERKDNVENVPESAAPAADEGQPGGLRKGAPEAFEPDMDVLINEDGQDKVLRYIGRARLVDAKGKVYEPDEEGSFLAFYDPTARGMERYVNTKYKEEYDAFLQKVVGYKPAEQQEAEQPAEPAAEVETPVEPVEEQQGESVQQEVEQPAEAPEVDIYNNVKGEYPEAYREKVENTVKIKAKRVDETKKALDKANDALTATEYGSKEEAAAKGKRDKAQQAYDAAVADNELWKAIKSLKDSETLAEQEAKDAAEREERERRRAETEAARQREREAYEAEMARRRAEQERQKEEAEAQMQYMANMREEQEQTKSDFPIENDEEAMREMNDLSPRTLEEVVAWMLADTKSNYKIDPSEIREQTGYGKADLRKLPFVFAKRENGGMSPEKFGEKVEQIARENDVVFNEDDTNAGFNALLNVLGEVGSLGDLKNYIKNKRKQSAEQLHSQNVAMAASVQAEDKWVQQNSGMTAKQSNEYMNSMAQAVESGVTMLTDEENDALFSNDVTDPFSENVETKPNSNDTRTETNDEGGVQRGATESSTNEPEAEQTATAADDTRRDGGVDAEQSAAEQPAGEVAAQIEAARAAVDTHPTEGQKKAGNYPMGHLKLDGYDITLENPKGSVRSGVDADGKAWSQEMHNDYGYIRGTEGVDGDHIDVFLSDDPTQGSVFVVDQVNADGSFDEHKVMYGFPDMESARKAYLSNYEEGWQGLGAITPVSKEEFKKWVESSHRKTKPFSEYKSVKTEGDVLVERQPSTADYRQQAEKAIADILDGVERGGSGPVVSPEMTEAIQKIADMEADAEERLEDNSLSGEERARVQAQYDAANKWMEEHVRSQKVDGKVQKPTKEQKVMVHSLVDLLNEMGVPTHLTVKEGQAVLDKYREMVRALRAYHGSGADFDRFDHSKIGTGEGAQAFGYGTYVTEVEGIGKSYAEKLGDRPVPASYKGMTAREIETKATVDFLHKTKGEPTELSESKWDALFGIVRSLNYGYGDPKRMIAVKRESLEDAIKRAEKRMEKWQSKLQDADDSNRESIENSIRRNQNEIDELNDTLDYVKSLNPADFRGWRRGGSHILYEVEIPDDNGSNYIEWNKIISKGVRDVIKNGLEKEGYTAGKPEDDEVVDSTIEYKKDGERPILLWDDATFESFMHDNFHSYDAVKETSLISKILHDAGFTGIKYPAEYLTGGREDGAKNYVIFDEGDLKIVDKIRFHKAEDGEYVPEMKPVFYSNAMKTVEGIKQEKATPEQWLKMIEKAGGLKAGEDKWTGLSEWLRGLTPNPSPNGEGSVKPRILTKQEVMDYLLENAIEVEEQKYYDAHDGVPIGYGNNLREEAHDLANNTLAEEFAKNLEEGMSREDAEDRAWNTVKQRMLDEYGSGVMRYFGIHLNEDGEPEVYTTGTDRAFNDFADTIWHRKNGDSENAKEANTTRISYTTKGLDNKREIALTIPTIESWNENDEVHFGDAGEGRAVAWVRFGETTTIDAPEDIRKQAKDALKALHDYQDEMREKYRGDYGVMPDDEKAKYDQLYEEFRVAKERERNAGHPKRVLVIDEIQSKRHQEGRERGYGRVPEAKMEDVVFTKHDGIVEGRYTVNGEEFVSRYEDFGTVKDAILDDINKQVFTKSIPDAPFEKNWHEVAMKRMLRYAAENGYDKVAWTTGEQQAQRYDLSKSIKDMTATGWTDYSALRGDEAKEAKLIAINTIDGGEYAQLLVDKNGKVLSDVDDQFVGKQLSDIVGKDLAKRLMEDGYQTIEGDGLRIGGEGMKGFYDQILPRFVDKYGKKWDVKTTDVELPNIGDNGLTMHSVDVTPEMKADVMDGQPMFFKTPEGEVYGFTLGGEIYIDPRYARPDTPIHEYIHLWAQALRDSNPTAWARLKEEMKGVDGGRLWDYVQRRYPELKNEDELVEEVFAHYGGKRGGERLEADMREEMKKANGIFEKAHVANIFHKLRRLLQRFWKMARDLFAGKVEGVEKLSAEDFADMALGDLMNGFNPSGKRKVESGKRDADVRFQKAGTYTTRDGVQLSMMSLFEEGESGVDGSNGLNGQDESGDLTELRLRKLAPGEMCLVERRYEENKQFSFTGSEKIESMDDVAYIFKQLEDAAVENVFLALVKDGKPTVIHIGMGTYAQSSLDFRLAFAAYKDIQPDAVYVVHNHPSGALKASKEDRNMLYNAKMYFGNDVVKDGIIIDTVSGKYGVFGFDGERENAMPESADHEVSVKTYEFSKQVFNEDWNPEEATKFADSSDIAAFISSQRLGEHPKMSFIVVNNQYQVVGNYFLPWTSISEIDDFKAAADELSNYVQLSGGTRGILYGNYQYDNTDKRNLQKLAAGMKSVGTPLTDVLHIDIHDELGYHSANDSEELTPEKEYEAPKREAGEDYLSYARRIVDDRNAYEAIVKAYEAFNSGVAESQVNDPGVDEILNDGSMGMREKITATAIKMANEQRDNMELRNNAVRAIGGNLMDIRKAMSLQREYDKGTVKRVADLARVLVKGGYLEGATNGEMSRILSIVKNATGKTDITGDIRKLMEIMVDSQLRRAEDMLREVESIKGSKVDAKGVEVQGKLDVAGQQVMKTFKETRDDKEEDLSQDIAEAENRMLSDDAAVAEEATNVRAGLILSLYYQQNIRSSKTEERKLREELDDARHATDRSLEFENTILESIQQNRVERLEAYSELMNMLGETLQKSVDAAKEFNDAAKERVREIQHNANSDMAGRPAKEHYKPKWKDKMANNDFVQFFFKPLATFDQMLRLFGSKSANGEGYLYNRFMRGWVDAREKEIRGVREKYAVLDEKVKSLFGGEAKNMADLIRLIGKMPKVTVLFKNGGELIEHQLTQGNLMYVYMVNKMLDGRMKLRKMGIDEKAINEVMRILDPRLMELADWMQEEFLVDSRNEYNETHKRIFGAPMAAIEHYFPLKINPNARVDKAEDLDDFDRNEGISTKTGSIIKRRRNALALDILNADALNVILDHVAKMEHWNAFAEFNRDLNTLRTYAHFRNQVKNMTTIYGSGDKLWEKFNDLCQMAAGTYRPKRANLDVAATNLAKGVTAAKVSFRIFTALKQFLSMPAYLPDARPDLWAKNLATPWKSWSWAMENLPIFEERWKSRIAGDPRLMKSELDWKGWRNNIVQMASKIGMSPNAFVDALTVSIGAKTIYESRKARYLKEGYSEEQAERKAKQDAEIAYNQTQQSSEGAFLSTMQVDRSWLSVMFTVFRNSSMAYQRQLHDALRNLKRDLKKGNREQSIEFMAKQMVRDGVDEEQAKEAATARYNRQVGKDALRVATFGFILQFCWNLGAYLPYLLFGDDDDKKSDMWDDIFAKSMFGWGEGLTGGDVFSEAGKMAVKGEGNPEYLKKEMPAMSDVGDILKEFGTKKYHEAITDIINLVVQAGIGVNPQSITDAVLAIMDACGNDPDLAKESLILYMRILQVPQSQIRELYLDEIGMTGEEASKLTPEELAERYAKYQVKRGRFFQPWEWNNKDDINREKKNATKKIKERVDAIGGSKVNKAYEQYEEQYKDYYAKVKEYTSSSEYKDATPNEKAQWLTELYKEDPQGYAVYSSFKNMDAMLDKMAKYYLASSTPQEAQACHKYIEEYKQAMVDVLGAESDEERASARKRRNDCVERFYDEVGNMQKTRTKEEKMDKEKERLMKKTTNDEDDADSMLK